MAADAILMGTRISKTFLEPAAMPAEDAMLVSGIKFHDRVPVPDPEARTLGLKLMAPRVSAKSHGLSQDEHRKLVTKLDQLQLRFLENACDSKLEGDRAVSSVPEDLRKLLWSVFTTAPADQLVPPPTYALVKKLSEQNLSTLQMTVSELKLLNTHAPVLSRGLMAGLNESRLPQPMRDLFAHLVKVAAICYPTYVRTIEGGTGETSASLLVSGNEGSNVAANQAAQAGPSTIVIEGLQASFVEQNPELQPRNESGDPDLRDMLVTGHYFGHRHGIKRSLRRYAMDASTGKRKNEGCNKYAYDSKKRVPGRYLLLLYDSHFNKFLVSSILNNSIIGVFIIWCAEHQTCLGFSLMRDSESPKTPFELLYTRWENAPEGRPILFSLN